MLHNESGLSIEISPAGETFRARNVPILQLIAWAYDIREEQISGGGAEWLHFAPYDIEAKVDDADVAAMKSMSREERRTRIRLMVQALLADRSQMRVTRQTKELPANVLVVAPGGSKLTPSKPAGANADPDAAKNMPPVGINFLQGEHGKVGIEGHQTSMARLAWAISVMIHDNVVDATGLKGEYDFKLEWPVSADSSDTDGSVATTHEAPGAAIYGVIEKQLGLKLEVRKVPRLFLLIDHIERPSPD